MCPFTICTFKYHEIFPNHPSTNSFQVLLITGKQWCLPFVEAPTYFLGNIHFTRNMSIILLSIDSLAYFPAKCEDKVSHNFKKSTLKC